MVDNGLNAGAMCFEAATVVYNSVRYTGSINCVFPSTHMHIRSKYTQHTCGLGPHKSQHTHRRSPRTSGGHTRRKKVRIEMLNGDYIIAQRPVDEKSGWSTFTARHPRRNNNSSINNNKLPPHTHTQQNIANFATIL